MSFPTPINARITDAVTQANVKVLGDSPALLERKLFKEEGSATLSDETGRHDLRLNTQSLSNNGASAAVNASGLDVLFSLDFDEYEFAL